MQNRINSFLIKISACAVRLCELKIMVIHYLKIKSH